MKLSNVASSITPSLARGIFNKAKTLTDVVDLTLGDPDLIPPQEIRDAACEAIQAGKSRYSLNAGLSELRAQYALSVQKEYGFLPDDKNEIIVTIGGMEALYLSLLCLCNPGDEVLVLAPYYVNYVQMVRMAGGVPVIIYSSEEEDFRLNPEKIEQAITDRTVAIMLNSPCNPTGEIIQRDILKEIAQIALKHDLMVLSDEVYRTLTFDGVRHQSIITEPGMRDHTILIDSMSKRFSMTGYRVGFAVAPRDLTQSMTKLQENIASCAPVPFQHAGIVAYRDCLEEKEILKTFENRRNFLYDEISKLPMLSCRKPQGTFYLFVNISKTGLKSIDFCEKLLDSERVACVPGVAYGAEYDSYIRLAFTHEEKVLAEGVRRIAQFLDTIKK